MPNEPEPTKMASPIDARDAFLGVGLVLLAGGLWLGLGPAPALVAVGAVLTYVAVRR